MLNNQPYPNASVLVRFNTSVIFITLTFGYFYWSKIELLEFITGFVLNETVIKYDNSVFFCLDQDFLWVFLSFLLLIL